MSSENEHIGNPNPEVYPLLPTAIQTASEEILNAPKTTLDEDLNEIIKGQPAINAFRFEILSKLAFSEVRYASILGVLRAYRLIKSQAEEVQIDVPSPTIDIFNALNSSTFFDFLDEQEEIKIDERIVETTGILRELISEDIREDILKFIKTAMSNDNLDAGQQYFFMLTFLHTLRMFKSNQQAQQLNEQLQTE